jgi:hypothetical protein
MQPTGMGQRPPTTQELQNMLEHQEGLLALAVDEGEVFSALYAAQSAFAASDDPLDSPAHKVVMMASAHLTTVMIRKHQIMVSNLEAGVAQLRTALQHAKSNIVLPSMVPPGGGRRH